MWGAARSLSRALGPRSSVWGRRASERGLAHRCHVRKSPSDRTVLCSLSVSCVEMSCGTFSVPEYPDWLGASVVTPNSGPRSPANAREDFTNACVC